MSLLIKNIDLLASPTSEGWLELKNAALITNNKQISFIGKTSEVDETQNFDKIIDARGCVVIPGLINCHHHLYQTLTRTIGTAGGKKLFDWLKLLYPIWAELTPEAVYTSAKMGLAELVLSGCTTVADHLYLFPNESKLDNEIAAAEEVGVRFHPTRGSMSLGESKGGLPPDRVVQSEEDILEDSQRVIE